MITRVREKVASAAVAVAFAALLVACGGPDHGVLGPDGAAIDATGAKARVAAAKPVGQDDAMALSDQGLFSDDQGGTLKVFFPEYGDDIEVQLRKVIFDVDEGSLSESAMIKMTAHTGNTLDDIWVAFEPSGLTFSPSAHLELWLRGSVTADDVQQVYHLYGDGSNVESIDTVVETNGVAFLVVSFNVSSFSEYSLGGEDTPEGDGP